MCAGTSCLSASLTTNAIAELKASPQMYYVLWDMEQQWTNVIEPTAGQASAGSNVNASGTLGDVNSFARGVGTAAAITSVFDDDVKTGLEEVTWNFADGPDATDSYNGAAGSGSSTWLPGQQIPGLGLQSMLVGDDPLYMWFSGMVSAFAAGTAADAAGDLFDSLWKGAPDNAVDSSYTTCHGSMITV
jgi:hypothetical protein